MADDTADPTLENEWDSSAAVTTPTGLAPFMGGVAKGMLWDPVTQTWQMARHPLDTASAIGSGLKSAAQNPLGAISDAWSSIKQGLQGGPASAGETIGSFIGPGDYAKGLKALEMTGEGAKGVRAISHTVEDGEHIVQSANGATYAQTAANGRDIQVTRSDTAAAAAGQGEGTDRMQALADAAHAQGGVLQSDVSVSPGAARTYEKLGDRGYDVRKNPAASTNPSTGNWVSDDPRKPVFTVHPPAPQ